MKMMYLAANYHLIFWYLFGCYNVAGLGLLGFWTAISLAVPGIIVGVNDYVGGGAFWYLIIYYHHQLT